MGEDHTETSQEFAAAVNLSARELERWLETEESQSVGQKTDGGESTGHAEGRRIVAILRAEKSELTDDDDAHMRKVVGYVHRHLEGELASPTIDSRSDRTATSPRRAGATR